MPLNTLAGFYMTGCDRTQHASCTLRAVQSLGAQRQAPASPLLVRVCLLRSDHAQDDGKSTKKSWKFLQKYWHKGAFFQDAGDAGKDAVGGDDIFRRDFSAPTGDDKMDKSVLPKARIHACLYDPLIIMVRGL